MTKKESAAVRERLNQLAKQNGGHLTPAAVVEDARRKGSPLRKCFDERIWDDSWAAEQYRNAAARVVIVRYSVEITKVENRGTIPVFVHNPSAPPKVQDYIHLSSIPKRSATARELLAVEFNRAITFLERTLSVAETLGLEKEFDRLLQNAQIIQERLGLVEA